MEELDELKKIGAKAISKETHIALNKIQSILDKNFEELKDRATTMGLIRILSREYKIDLSDWIKEYDNFMQNYHAKEEIEDLINLKITHEVVQNKDPKKSIIFLVFAVVLGGIGYYLYYNFSQYQTHISDEINTTELLEINQTKSASEELNQTEFIAAQTLPVPQVSESIPKEDSTPLSASLPAPLPDTIAIKPLANMWIGIIYLDTKQKASLVTSEPLELNRLREQTIITGHGMLEMQEGQEIQSFNLAGRMRFYIDKQGHIKQITENEFLKLNGGVVW